MSMEESNLETGAMYRRAVDSLDQLVKSPPETEALYQFVMNSGYAVVAGEMQYRHTLHLMLNRREAIEVIENLLEQLKDPVGHGECLVELKGKMIVTERDADD